jgi:hypothetical protein
MAAESHRPVFEIRIMPLVKQNSGQLAIGARHSFIVSFHFRVLRIENANEQFASRWEPSKLGRLRPPLGHDYPLNSQWSEHIKIGTFPQARLFPASRAAWRAILAAEKVSDLRKLTPTGSA